MFLQDVSHGVMLQGVTGEDHGFLLELYNNPTVVMNALEPSNYPVSATHVERTVSAFASGNDKLFIVKVGGERVGMAMLYETSPVHRRCKYGLVLLPEYTGKKVGKVVTELILDYCFHYLNMGKVSGEIHAHNDKAVGLVESLGFSHEGTLKRHVFREGDYHDMFLYGLQANQYHVATVNGWNEVHVN